MAAAAAVGQIYLCNRSKTQQLMLGRSCTQSTAAMKFLTRKKRMILHVHRQLKTNEGFLWGNCETGRKSKRRLHRGNKESRRKLANEENKTVAKFSFAFSALQPQKPKALSWLLSMSVCWVFTILQFEVSVRTCETKL